MTEQRPLPQSSGQDVAIVIVNWNSGAHLRQCVESVAAAVREQRLSRIVVVDNGSTDGSADNLPALNGKTVLFKNDLNRGFAAASNQGASACRSEYLLFLNPDVILTPGSLDHVISHMEDPSNSDVGICGIRLVDEDGQVCRSCARVPSMRRFAIAAFGLGHMLRKPHWGHFMLEWDHENTADVDQVIGAFYLIRTGLFAMLRGFDERFFLYFEEVDLSVRAREVGFRSRFLATAHALHYGGWKHGGARSLRLFHYLRSRILFCFKHMRPWEAWGVVLLTAFVEPLTRTIGALWNRDAARPRVIRAVYSQLWMRLPDLVRLATERGGK